LIAYNYIVLFAIVLKIVWLCNFTEGSPILERFNQHERLSESW